MLSLYMFRRIIFPLLIVGSLSCNFHRFAVCFQAFINIACRSTQNAARIKRFLRLHIVIKPLNKESYYMAESVFAMRLVNLRSVTCYTDQNF